MVLAKAAQQDQFFTGEWAYRGYGREISELITYQTTESFKDQNQHLELDLVLKLNQQSSL